MRRSPLCCSENVAGQLIPIWFTGPDAPFNLALRPHEFSMDGPSWAEIADQLINSHAPDTALPLALALHDIKMLQLLLEKGADPNMRRCSSLAPPRGSGRAFKNAYIATVIAKDSRVTPLMLAVISEQVDAVRLLLQHGGEHVQIHTKASGAYPLRFRSAIEERPGDAAAPRPGTHRRWRRPPWASSFRSPQQKGWLML